MFEVAEFLLSHYVTFNTKKEVNQWNLLKTRILGWDPSGYIKDRTNKKTKQLG